MARSAQVIVFNNQKEIDAAHMIREIASCRAAIYSMGHAKARLAVHGSVEKDYAEGLYTTYFNDISSNWEDRLSRDESGEEWELLSDEFREICHIQSSPSRLAQAHNSFLSEIVPVKHKISRLKVAA